MELLAISIGIGLVIGLLMTEFFGVASGGLIVPGYVALNLTKPYALLATIGVALVTYVLVRALASFMIVYGRRRTALMILVGYILGMLVQQALGPHIQDFHVIGFIIPGLIAIWMDRQGAPATFASLAVVAVLVRLVLVVSIGTELLG